MTGDRRLDLAIGERCDCSADLGSPLGYRTDELGEERLPNRLDVVERGDTRGDQSVFRVQGDLSRNPTNGPSDGGYDNPVEYDYRFTSRDDKHRTPFVFRLSPPYVTLCRAHHGSSLIISTVAMSAQPTSSSF